MRAIIFLLLTAALCGCGRSDESPTAVAEPKARSSEKPGAEATAADPVPAKKSAAEDVIDAMTGKTVVDKGKEAAEDIREINADRQEQLDALGEF